MKPLRGRTGESPGVVVGVIDVLVRCVDLKICKQTQMQNIEIHPKLDG